MPRPQGRVTVSSTIELQRPVPLQEVADGPTCAAAPTVFDDADTHSHISPSVLPVDEDGLSDDEFEQASFTPTPPTRSEPFLSAGYRSYARTLGVFGQLPANHSVHLGSEPVDLISQADGTTTGTYRHDPYYPVLPEWYSLMHEGPTEEDCDCIVDEDVEPVAALSSDIVYTADDWDAPRAATSSSSTETPIMTTTTRMLEDPFAGIEDELASTEEPDVEGANIDQQAPEASSPVPRVMCCYFKQSGRCKMGTDCWYSHEGDASTPCHYGAICKAGHAQLVKTGNSAVGPRRLANSKRNQSQGSTQRQSSQATQPPRNAPARSAPLIPSALPCAFCGDSTGVLLQEFPVYEGNAKSIAYRAHCTNPGCLRVYSL